MLHTLSKSAGVVKLATCTGGEFSRRYKFPTHNFASFGPGSLDNTCQELCQMTNRPGKVFAALGWRSMTETAARLQ